MWKWPQNHMQRQNGTVCEGGSDHSYASLCPVNVVVTVVAMPNFCGLLKDIGSLRYVSMFTYGYAGSVNIDRAWAEHGAGQGAFIAILKSSNSLRHISNFPNGLRGGRCVPNAIGDTKSCLNFNESLHSKWL